MTDCNNTECNNNGNDDIDDEIYFDNGDTKTLLLVMVAVIMVNKHHKYALRGGISPLAQHT
jgi:hypothetical protein